VVEHAARQLLPYQPCEEAHATESVRFALSCPTMYSDRWSYSYLSAWTKDASQLTWRGERVVLVDEWRTDSASARRKRASWK
jgi:hypothetical protein